MKRRQFIAGTALSAIAFSASGFIRFNGNSFEGACETTTDILGPFYRPNSPVRKNLILPGDAGLALELSGTIKHQDCKTPYKNAKIELWHCDNEGVYDNDSDAYKYRATSYCDEQGQYSFNTILPVPYDTGSGNFRPAHFHIMVTAEGYQPLVTQLYFADDEYIAGDMMASVAKGRVLTIQSLESGVQKVIYDVSMANKLLAETSVLTRLAGRYVQESDDQRDVEFFAENGVLWIKREPYGENLDYVGENTFSLPGIPNNMSLNFVFKPLASGTVQLTRTFTNAKGENKVNTFTKDA